MKGELVLGAHMSIAGGLHLACGRARDEGCDALQIFTRDQQQWKARPIGDDEAAAFRRAVVECGVRVAFAHDR